MSRREGGNARGQAGSRGVLRVELLLEEFHSFAAEAKESGSLTACDVRALKRGEREVMYRGIKVCEVREHSE